jgi:hypothetical protein
VRGLPVLVVLAACSAVELPVLVPPVSRGTVRIRSFTEPGPARQVRAVGPFVFVVTHQGIERWGRDGEVSELRTDPDALSQEVLAIESDAERKTLWILSPGSLVRYDTSTEESLELGAPPASATVQPAALHPGDHVALATANNGVWVGTSQGLAYCNAEGWTATTIKDPVLSIATSSDGIVVATTKGLFLRRGAGEVLPIGAEQGSQVTHPERVLAVPKLGGTLVLGSDERGAPRMALGQGLQWDSFRVLPGVDFDDAVVHGDEVILMGGGQLYHLTLRDANEAQPLARDGVRLSAMSSTGPDLALAAMPMMLPAGPLSLAVSNDQLLVGTRAVGVARYFPGEVRPSSWLRRRRMFLDASSLSVACTAPDDCWVATGSRSAWHWTGDRFTAGGPQEVVLAVVRDRSGAIYALHREALAREIQLSRVDSAGQWTRLPKAELVTPGQEALVRFARFSASGALWVGLRYRDGAAVRTWGVAVMEIGSGKVQYHHSVEELDDPAAGNDPNLPGDDPNADPQRRKKQALFPANVVDADLRGDVAWFATAKGVVQLSPRAWKIWDETSGLRPQAARAIAASRGSAVFVVTDAGVGRFNGTAWQRLPQLGVDVNDLVVTAAGQLWMATSRGIAAYDGTSVRRVDVRRGLVENDVLEIAVDRYDRIWGRGLGSLTLISP